MADWKETRFDLTGVEHIGEEHTEKHMLVYLIDNEDGSKTLSVETLEYCLELPFDDIYEYCRSSAISRCADEDASEEEQLLGRLHILQKQLNDYTEADYLCEAEALEREMQEAETKRKREVRRPRSVRGPKLDEQ